MEIASLGYILVFKIAFMYRIPETISIATLREMYRSSFSSGELLIQDSNGYDTAVRAKPGSCRQMKMRHWHGYPLFSIPFVVYPHSAVGEHFASTPPTNFTKELA
ncbi:MAG: hypothetical protein A3I66_11180 [Burkholderiales bacterium RIFCSPLOWO2_02_FULL_57_36]|nr:MAG: hypothetical protein A3I66_11180 [Burkholderiales bacterium RIFCSPLOWO2_02_FULL_57_36]